MSHTDSNPAREPCLEKPAQDHKDLAHMNHAIEEALQLLPHIVELKEQMETALEDTTRVQVLAWAPRQLEVQEMVLELAHRLAVDDGIYMLHRTYIASFSYSRNILFHPDAKGNHNNLMTHC